MSETINAEADRLIRGARNDDYGHPADDFARAGRMWGAILGLPDVTPEQVALCMIAVKIAREVHRPKRDNLVDIAGYAGTVEMIRERTAQGAAVKEKEGALAREHAFFKALGMFPSEFDK